MDQAHQAIPSMEKEQCMIITYHKIRNISKEKARELVRKVLEKNECCVQKTAQILGICRKTVRRARDGTLSDYSRRPKNGQKKINSHFEDLIVAEGMHTGYGAKQLTSFLFQKYGHNFSMYTVKKILKKNKVLKKRIRTKNRNSRHLYDYEHLAPFREFQLDTNIFWIKKLCLHRYMII
jgi:hypothetical protein